ncbi:hypothetical protein [Streptomyces liangshanensis]|uniref:hypothetical protein n=1 Tax=Streptomyces liangshanensis TaxID=2717324 RepID=UPI0036DE7A04
MRVSTFAKALAAGFAAAAAAVATAVQDGVFTTGEGVTVALAVFGAYGITYVVPNKQQPAA